MVAARYTITQFLCFVKFFFKISKLILKTLFYLSIQIVSLLCSYYSTYNSCCQYPRRKKLTPVLKSGVSFLYFFILVFFVKGCPSCLVLIFLKHIKMLAYIYRQLLRSRCFLASCHFFPLFLAEQHGHIEHLS